MLSWLSSLLDLIVTLLNLCELALEYSQGSERVARFQEIIQCGDKGIYCTPTPVLARHVKVLVFILVCVIDIYIGEL